MKVDKISQEAWNNWLDHALVEHMKVHGQADIPDNLTPGKASSMLAEIMVDCTEQFHCPWSYKEMFYRVLQLQIFYLMLLEEVTERRKSRMVIMDVKLPDLSNKDDFLGALADALEEKIKEAGK